MVSNLRHFDDDDGPIDRRPHRRKIRTIKVEYVKENVANDKRRADDVENAA